MKLYSFFFVLCADFIFFSGCYRRIFPIILIIGGCNLYVKLYSKAWIYMIDHCWWEDRIATTCMIFVNVPWYFSMLYSMFNPFVTPRTCSKFVTCIEEMLRKHFTSMVSGNSAEGLVLFGFVLQFASLSLFRFGWT